MISLLIALSVSMFVSLTAFAAGDAHGGGGKAHRDNTTLFPQPVADHARGTAPASVKLTEPAMLAKVSGATTNLQWQASEGATAYHVQVATDPNFKWLKADEHWVKETSFQASGLEAGKTYYWRVAPWKDGNLASTNKGAFARSAFEVQ